MPSLSEAYRVFTPAGTKSVISQLSHQQQHYLTERATFLTYLKVVQGGDTVFDLGANHGAHTRELSAIVGPLGHVHAFEPNPVLTPALQQIDANVTVYEAAIGDKNSTAVLRVPDGLDGWASLDDRTHMLPDHKFREYEVAVRVIDQIEQLRDARPTFIKIDVEGYELQSLRGMAGILKNAMPIVVFENLTEEIFGFFKELGYGVFDFFGGSSFPAYQGLMNSVAIPNDFPEHDKLFLNERDFAFLLVEYMTLSKMP